MSSKAGVSDRETVKVQPEALLAETTRYLAEFNRWRLLPGLEPEGEARGPADEEALMMRVELDFLETELSRVQSLASEAPKSAEAFLRWFEDLELHGPGQHDPLFDWLADSASEADMRWFLAQEVAGEAGFEDLVALTQVKMPTRAKLELARNYWDEMGQGQPSAMHGPMLARLAVDLGIEPANDVNGVEWECLALSNLMVGLAVHRRHAYRSIGALGVVELTAPARARCVNEGLKRLGIAGESRRYYALHSTLDIKHSAAWNREVIGPLIASDPRLARPIAEGALARLTAGARCFERYTQVLPLESR